MADAYKSAPPPDVLLAELAAEQQGVVCAAQLAELGLSPSAIQARVRNGRLHRIHHGVYAVGHRSLTLQGRFVAGVLACGPMAALSYHAAGADWGIRKWEDRLIDVTVLGRGARSRPGLLIHRTRALDPRDVRRRNGIRVTTPARTLLDLADVLPDKGLRRAVRQAQALNLAQVPQIADVLTRANGRRGAKRLAALIAGGPAPTASDLEDLVLDVIDNGGLKRPQINRRLGRIYPDLRWPEQKLTVECDGATWHESKLAREDDAERQARLEADGERVLRVSWQQAFSRPDQTLTRLIAAGAPRREAEPPRTAPYTDTRS